MAWRGGRRSVASGWCVRSSGSVQSEARGGPGVLLLSSVLGAGASKLGNKQEQQHRSFAEVVAEKGTAHFPPACETSQWLL